MQKALNRKQKGPPSPLREDPEAPVIATEKPVRAKKTKLAQSISDAAWGEWIILEYKYQSRQRDTLGAGL